MKTSDLTNTPSPDRPIWKRWTFIGGFIIVAIQYAESNFLIPVGTATEVANLAQIGGGLLSSLGIYRHFPTS